MGIAEVYEKLGDFSSALKFLNDTNATISILLHKARLLFSISQYDHSLKTLDVLLKQISLAEGFFLKAECHNRLKQYNEAALSYEQCLMYDNDSDLTSNALYNLGALKIREKDFYGALHTFQRCIKGKLREQKILEIYADAVINAYKV